MKEYFSSLFGNDALKRQIGACITHDALPHGYLLLGPNGSGKMTFARLIACALSCEQKGDAALPLPCLHCDSCRKILSGNSTAVYIPSKGDKATLPLDTVREMRADMYLSHGDGSRKVYILPEAHTLTAACQNALLKVIEEPPQGVFILFLCETTDTILETVKSRLQTLRMQRFSGDTIRTYLLQTDPSAEKYARESKEMFFALTEAAEGSIGQAKEHFSKKEADALLQKRKEIVSFVAEISRKRDYASIYRAVFALSGKRAETAERLEGALTALRDLILCKKAEDVSLLFFSDRAEAHSLSEMSSLGRWIGIHDAILHALTALQQNAHIQTVLHCLVQEIKDQR